MPPQYIEESAPNVVCQYMNDLSTPKEQCKGLVIAFKDLSYKVPLKKNNRGNDGSETFTILDNISGSFLPGKMTALMGPSGSGKSTLLDVLSGRKNSGTVSGNITYNGHTLGLKQLRRYVGYVEQFDTLVGELTVEDMLAYTAALKLPASMTAQERKLRVDEVIDRLNLGSCRRTVIGSTLVRGISGGQAKRVNIGLALITRPRVLMLDEPTSGLDSRTADEVVDLLRDLAREGRTVIVTIHAPSGRAFGRFDNLHMLQGGRTIFDGSLGRVQEYFEGLGHVRDHEMSLPEWLVDLTGDAACAVGHDEEDGKDARTGGGRDFGALYASSDLCRAALARHKSTLRLQLDISKDEKAPSQWTKLRALLKYRAAAHYRDGEFLGTRFGDKILFALLIMSLYWGIGDDADAQSIQSTASLLYFISAICGYGAAAFVPSLTLERSLYYRELADDCYRPLTYYLFKFVEESAVAIATSLLFTLIIFFALSLQGSFLILFGTYYLTTMMGIILAYAVAAISPTMEAANAILPTLVTIWMYFGGLFIIFDKIPAGWQWFSWSSFLRYSWGAMMQNQFQVKDEGVGNDGYDPATPVFYAEDGTGMTVLEFYGLEGPIMGSVGACLGMLAALIGFFSFVGVLGLQFIRHDKR